MTIQDSYVTHTKIVKLNFIWHIFSGSDGKITYETEIKFLKLFGKNPDYAVRITFPHMHQQWL